MNFKYGNTVTFRDIINAGLFTGGPKIAKGKYRKDENNNITGNMPVINAIDIDWCNANVIGLDEPITSTGQLLSIIGQLSAQVNNLAQKTDNLDGIKHIILTQEEYEALEKYEENTLYLVIGEDEEYAPTPTPGPTPEPSDDPFENITTNLIVSYLNDEGIIQEDVYSEDGVITLNPQKSYTLNGSLKGSILIDVSTLSKVNNDTELIFDNVTILSDTNNAITYKLASGQKSAKSLKVTLLSNTENYIYCTEEAENNEDQIGAIYSMNNLFVQGVGYLALKTKSGHGFKADDINLCGSHIWIDAPHDGIHGRDIHIIGGVYSINNCNDAIGTSSTGRVLLYDGNIITNNIAEHIIDSKNKGLYFSEDLLTEEQLSKCNNMLLLNEENYKLIYGDNAGKIEVLPGQPDFENGINDSGEEVQLDTTTGKYIISNEKENKGKYVVVYGYINKPIEFSGYGQTQGDSVTLYLHNAFINTHDNVSTSGELQSIYYGSEASNIKIMAVQDTVNIIKNNYVSNSDDASTFDSDCVKSENNIEVELKNNSYLYISSLYSDGLDGGEVKITDSKGSLIISKCGQRGIKGNAIVIGPNAVITESNIDYCITDKTNDKYSTFDGICYIKNNCKIYIPEIVNGPDEVSRKNSGFADIYCRNGKASKNKGQFATTNIELNGVLIIGTIGAVNKINMGNAKKFYYNEVIERTDDIQYDTIPVIGKPTIANEVEPANETKLIIDF